MMQTDDAALALAIDRLEWALGTPLGRDAGAWCDRVGRGLAHVKTALDRHAAEVESPAGLFDQVAGRGLLPFTAPARQVTALCQEHRNLRATVAGLRALLDEATRRRDSRPAALRLHEVRKLGGSWSPCSEPMCGRSGVCAGALRDDGTRPSRPDLLGAADRHGSCTQQNGGRPPLVGRRSHAGGRPRTELAGADRRGPG
jgi:hypothetical protein